MKKGIVFLVTFLLVPYVLADVTITIDNSEFNLGDKLTAGVEIIQEEDLEGFFRLSIICDNNNTFDYYATPVSLKANVEKQINIEPMVLFEDLLGECYLDGVLKTPQDYIIDQAPSALFIVSDALNIFLSKSSFVTDPGDSININGNVKKINDDNIDKADLTLTLDDNPTTFTIKNGIIEYNLAIPSNIKSGTHFIDIKAEDQYSNKGKEVIDLNVNPIPTLIETELNKDSFIPSETLEVEVKLLDQANDLMDGLINFEIINPENGKIHMQTVSSDSIIYYEFEKYSMPGEYKLRGFMDNVLTEDPIVIEEYERLKVTLEDSILFVENIGNIKYNKKTTIILEDEEGKTYIVRKRINLRIGEFTTLDLSEEVPEGNYKVELPEETVENVVIEDNRNFLKKMGQGLDKITGGFVGNSDKALMSPFFASIIVIVIILTIVLVANKNRIKRLFRRY